MCISDTRLGLPKAFIQLLCMQVHILYIPAWCNILFQIRFSGFSGVLPHGQTTCSKVTACNLKDCKPDVQSHQSMWFNVITGNNRKFEYKSLLCKFHSNIIIMGFPTLMKSDKCFVGAILSSLIINGTCDIQQVPQRSKYLWDLKAPRPKPPL